MALSKNKDQDQQRKTYNDVLMYQQKMREIVINKMKHNDVLHEEEKEQWMRTCGYALLIQGMNRKAFFELPLVTIPFGSVHSFSLRFLDWDSVDVVLEFNKKKYTVTIRRLWKLLYSYMLDLFPRSLASAVGMSKESEDIDQWSPYDFQANKKIE